MKRSAMGSRWHWMAAALLLAAGGAWAEPTQVVTRSITKFRVPDFDENGHKKSEIFGDVADVLTDGRIKITGLRIVLYDKDGTTIEGTVTAVDCIYDRNDKSAFSNTAVSLQRNAMVVTGKGMRWNADGQHIEILNDVRVELKGARMWNKLERP